MIRNILKNTNFWHFILTNGTVVEVKRSKYVNLFQAIHRVREKCLNT